MGKNKLVLIKMETGMELPEVYLRTIILRRLTLCNNHALLQQLIMEI